MALNNISFVLGKGGLSRPLPGADYISGLIFYTASLPSGFSTTNRAQQIFSVAQAEALGISGTYADETAATGTYLSTVIGAAGNTATFKVVEPFGATVTIGVYAWTAADTTVALQAASIAAAINAGTNVHGYIATVATATVTIKARPGLGIFLNTNTPLSVTLSAGAVIAGTLTAFSGGVASKQAVYHYHIQEYFRIQPQGNLWIGFYAVPGSYTFSEITSLQNVANGTIRQFGIFKDSAAFASADIQAIDTVCKTLVSQHKECVALYAADISATPLVSSLLDLSGLNANTVAAIVSQDGAALGAFLYATYGKSITNLGAALGAVSKAAVSQSIAWVANFNMSNGTENGVVAFANGVLYSDATITDALLTQLQNYCYTFLRTYVGTAGAYWNENRTCVISTSSYAFLADNRTIQKATRNIYAALTPALSSPIILNADGTISDIANAYFTGLTEGPLNQMIKDGDLSAMQVVIGSVQNVLTTGILTITVNLVPVGTARNITVNIGYQVKIN